MRIAVCVAVMIGGLSGRGIHAEEANCLRPVPAFRIDSGSMLPGIPAGATVIVQCWSHAVRGSSIPPEDIRLEALDPPVRRGDLVVFNTDRSPSTTYLKRVIGLPGDRIQLRTGRLFINGVVAARDQNGSMSAGDAAAPVAMRYRETLPEGRAYDILEVSDAQPFDNTIEFVVPDNNVFVLGDNRDNSLDSRARSVVGYVPANLLIAVPHAVIQELR